jgi:hypothetical protein
MRVPSSSSPGKSRFRGTRARWPHAENGQTPRRVPVISSAFSSSSTHKYRVLIEQRLTARCSRFLCRYLSHGHFPQVHFCGPQPNQTHTGKSRGYSRPAIMQNPAPPADGHPTVLEKTSTGPATSHRESSETGNGHENVEAQHGTTERATVGNEKEVAVEDNIQAVGDDSNDTAEEPEDHSRYLTGFKLWILTLGLCLTTFVIALDNTIIATAIPKITTVFNSLEDVGWYGSSYLLTTTSLQPSFGKIYTYFDVKYTYLFALVLFEAGSIICAAATSSAMFIIGRAVAGAGAAALFSGGMNIIGYSVALAKRPIYIAALSSMFGIASIVGPILGGVLTDRASWR